MSSEDTLSFFPYTSVKRLLQDFLLEVLETRVAEDLKVGEKEKRSFEGHQSQAQDSSGS